MHLPLTGELIEASEKDLLEEVDEDDDDGEFNIQFNLLLLELLQSLDKLLDLPPFNEVLDGLQECREEQFPLSKLTSEPPEGRGEMMGGDSMPVSPSLMHAVEVSR